MFSAVGLWPDVIIIPSDSSVLILKEEENKLIVEQITVEQQTWHIITSIAASYVPHFLPAGEFQINYLS